MKRLAQAAENLFLAACLLAVVLALLIYGTSCARLIPGTSVPAPAIEHEDFTRAKCWSPTGEPDHACCVYSRELEAWRLVCTKDSGDSREVIDGGQVEDEGPHAARARPVWPCWRWQDGDPVRCA